MSRYYDYDYDRNCIIGFGSDEDNGLTVTPTSKYPDNESISSDSMHYSPSQSSIKSMSTSTTYDADIIYSDSEAMDDNLLYILPADRENIDLLKLKPLKLDVPFLLVSDMLKQQENEQKKESERNTEENEPVSLLFGDSLDALNTDCNLWIQSGLFIIDPLNGGMHNIDCQQLQRMDDYNGSYYNTFGTTIVSKQECHIWRLQLFGTSPAIIGIIEATAKQEINGAYFGNNNKDLSSYSFNTVTAERYSSKNGQHPIYQRMLQSGRLDKPMIIDIKLDLYHGTMTIANKTNGCQHYGKEIPLFDDININKSYKLSIALLGPETINLF